LGFSLPCGGRSRDADADDLGGESVSCGRYGLEISGSTKRCSHSKPHGATYLCNRAEIADRQQVFCDLLDWGKCWSKLPGVSSGGRGQRGSIGNEVIVLQHEGFDSRGRRRLVIIQTQLRQLRDEPVVKQREVISRRGRRRGRSLRAWRRVVLVRW
jgi:hypothetical protein